MLFRSEVVVADTESLNQEVVVEDSTTQKKSAIDPMMEQYAKTISQTLKG